MDNVKAAAPALVKVTFRKRKVCTFGAAIAAVVLSAFLAAPSDARGRHPSYDLSLVPPPPPTPVLNVAPPPMVLPYSYAYQNYQPNVSAAPRQEQLTRILAGPGTGTSVPWPFSPASAGTAQAHSMSAIEAQIRGFGKPRQSSVRVPIPGSATAAPHVATKTSNPWYDSCFNWYLTHAAAAQRNSAQPQVARGLYFQPPFPASMQPPEPPPAVKSPVSGYVTKTSMANAHAQMFRHRRRVIASR